MSIDGGSAPGDLAREADLAVRKVGRHFVSLAPGTCTQLAHKVSMESKAELTKVSGMSLPKDTVA